MTVAHTQTRAQTAPPAQGVPRLRAIALAAVAAAVGQESADLARRAARPALADGEGWRAAFAAARRSPAPADMALIRLAGELRLCDVELLAVALATAVEEEPLAGRAVAAAQAPLGGSRPTLGLLDSAFAPLTPGAARPLHQIIGGAALACGLLSLPDEGAPLAERALCVPTHICLALAGFDGGAPGVQVAAAEPTLALPPSVLAEAGQHAQSLAGGGRALLLRCGSLAEGRAAAAALAACLGRRPLYIEREAPPALGPWLLLRGLLPVFCCELGAGERRSVPGVAGYAGPLIALCGPEGAVELAGAAALTWQIGVPAPAERAALWHRALGDADMAAELARDYRHGSGRIDQLARLSRQRAAARGTAQPTRDDITSAAMAGEGGDLEGLAQPVPGQVDAEALVLTPALRRELELLLWRCRLRDGLPDDLGPAAAARYQPGVRALFVGPSGTGKTMAASWLAGRLGMPLFRVDLAAVTSKYIGETEKNLSTLMARAEHAELLLLFDEADSLFGKRTDVRDSNDRFANAQTNYLLQRIESFSGIALLTSNSRSRFDSAFARRLDAIVEFGLPGPEERRALWLAHLGPRHGLSGGELNRLAAAADLGGGHIRNAVLTAAVGARAAGHAIGYADLLGGLADEYRKLGRQLPAQLGGG